MLQVRGQGQVSGGPQHVQSAISPREHARASTVFTLEKDVRSSTSTYCLLPFARIQNGQRMKKEAELIRDPPATIREHHKADKWTKDQCEQVQKLTPDPEHKL